MMLYSIIPSEMVMLDLSAQTAECKKDENALLLSTNPRDFIKSTEIKLNSANIKYFLQ